MQVASGCSNGVYLGVLVPRKGIKAERDELVRRLREQENCGRGLARRSVAAAPVEGHPGRYPIVSGGG